MQKPPGEEPLKGLDGHEQMLGSFAEQAKALWRSWGPIGEPMVRGIEARAQMQCAYLQWLRQTSGAVSRP